MAGLYQSSLSPHSRPSRHWAIYHSGVRYRALVGADSAHCISEIYKLLVLKWSPCILSRPLQNDHLERAHQVRCICLLLKVVLAIMVYLRLLICAILQELIELKTEGVGKSEVEWAKVFEERLVYQFLYLPNIRLRSPHRSNMLLSGFVEALYHTSSTICLPITHVIST